MPTVEIDPPVADAVPADGFIQSVRLIDAGQSVARCRWHVAGDGGSGVVQLLELFTQNVRKGHGKQMFDVLLSQIRAYFKARNVRPRRIWISVEQKSQVVGRAFLTQHGFHHVATSPSLYPGQDGLIYVLSLD